MGVGSLRTGGFHNDAVEKPVAYCLLPPTTETAWSFPAYPTLPFREAFLGRPHPALTMAYSASPLHVDAKFTMCSVILCVTLRMFSWISALLATGVLSES